MYVCAYGYVCVYVYMHARMYVPGRDGQITGKNVIEFQITLWHEIKFQIIKAIAAPLYYLNTCCCAC